jgi:ribosomal-protein-alanine N-acetyltransferase
VVDRAAVELRSSLDETELLGRLDQLVPGDAAPGGDVPFAGADLCFERLSMAGLDEMHRYSKNERLYEHLEFKPFQSIEDTRVYIEKLQSRVGTDPSNRRAMYWFTRRKSDGHLIGSAGLVELNLGRQSVEWGYGIDPDMWGQGYILPVQAMLKHYVFEVLQLNRLSGVTMLENDRTISSVLAAGMTHEGTARQYYRKDGVYRDGWMYGMLADDYFRSSTASSPYGGKYAEADVIAIVASVLTEEEITAASNNLNTASWDSLSHMMIMEAVVEKTGFNLSPSQIMRATSVGSLLTIVNEAS